MEDNLQSYCKDLPAAKFSKLKVRRTLRGHISKVYSFQWGSNSRYLVSASQDGRILVWDGLTGNKLDVIALRSPWVMTCTYSPSLNLVACGGLDNICYIYRVNGKESPTNASLELVGHEGFLSCARFLDEKRVLTASGDQSCALWDLEKGRMETSFPGHNSEVMVLAVNPTDSNLFISGCSNGYVSMWDLRTTKPFNVVKVHDRDINWLSWFPNGTAFGSASDDSTVRLFDIRASSELMRYATEDSNIQITSVSFSKGGNYLFVGQDDFKVAVWDTLKGNKLYELIGHTARVSGVEVSPDGTAVCTSSWDGDLRLWA